MDNFCNPHSNQQNKAYLLNLHKWYSYVTIVFEPKNKEIVCLIVFGSFDQNELLECHKQLFIGYCIRVFYPLRWNVIIGSVLKKRFCKKKKSGYFLGAYDFKHYKTIFVNSTRKQPCNENIQNTVFELYMTSGPMDIAIIT